jgi:hypothetical protein
MSGRNLLLATMIFPLACIVVGLLMMHMPLLDSLWVVLIICPLLLLYGFSVVFRVEVKDTELVMDTLFRKVRVSWAAVQSASRVSFVGQRLRIFVDGYWGAFDVFPSYVRDFQAVASNIQEHYAEAKQARRELK